MDTILDHFDDRTSSFHDILLCVSFSVICCLRVHQRRDHIIKYETPDTAGIYLNHHEDVFLYSLHIYSTPTLSSNLSHSLSAVLIRHCTINESRMYHLTTVASLYQEKCQLMGMSLPEHLLDSCMKNTRHLSPRTL